MIGDKLTDLMNAVRTKYALTDKLSIDDATGYIDNGYYLSVVDNSTNFGGNNGSLSSPAEGIIRFTADRNDSNPTSGIYKYYNQKLLKPGSRYNLSMLIRGNMMISKLGEESSPILISPKQLDPEKWTRLSVNFIAKSDYVIYGKTKKGEWMEIRNWLVSEFLGGGVTKLPLFAFLRGGARYAA
ncbi:MAG TPA: hypothetical protein H9721_02140 [Candidatus Limosilactobacillus intestinipullorum]|nr:hypothetical protein [Candidatus Limosilactobacillus intestinipullorum]